VRRGYYPIDGIFTEGKFKGYSISWTNEGSYFDGKIHNFDLFIVD